MLLIDYGEGAVVLFILCWLYWDTLDDQLLLRDHLGLTLGELRG